VWVSDGSDLVLWWIFGSVRAVFSNSVARRKSLDINHSAHLRTLWKRQGQADPTPTLTLKLNSSSVCIPESVSISRLLSRSKWPLPRWSSVGISIQNLLRGSFWVIGKKPHVSKRMIYTHVVNNGLDGVRSPVDAVSTSL
jgi:hypothetical protein